MKLFLSSAFFLITGVLFGQNLRCLSSQSYNIIKNGGVLSKVSKPILICFNDYYFSFYTPGTGTRTFKIAHNSMDTLHKGYARQRFMNEEDETNMEGDYNIEVDYEKQKTVIINFSRFGEAYVVQVPNFDGSAEQSEGKYSIVKKGMSDRRRTDTAFNPNYELNPQLKKMTAKTYIDINRYISSKIRWTGPQGELQLSITINKEGEPHGTIISSLLPTGRGDVKEEAMAIFNSMPKWTTPYDQYGMPKAEHGVLNIVLSEIK
jgi:hypothetical protein